MSACPFAPQPSACLRGYCGPRVQGWGWEQQPHVPVSSDHVGCARLLGAPGSLHQDGWQGDRWDLHEGTSVQHWTGERSSHLPALGRAGDQSCLLPACRTCVPGSVGLGAGFPGSPKVGTGEGGTFYCNSLMGAMSTASPLSPTAGVAAISPADSIAVVQGGGWLLCLAALNSLFNIGHPQNILPKGQKEVLTMSIAKLFSQKLENIFCQR